MNPFLSMDGKPEWYSRRVYGLIDQVEPEDVREGEQAWVLLDCIDADWFDEGQKVSLFAQRPFDSLPISITEIPLSWGDYEWVDEGTWIEVMFADGPTPVEARHFRNLFVEGESRFVESIRSLSRNAAALLSNAWELPGPDASGEQLDAILGAVPVADFVSVLDVGQGNWNALWRQDGGALLHFDAGGGVLQHAPSFPSAGIIPCLTESPPIVLSHWDWDHWSSGARYPQLQLMPWIVPRQSLGPVHRTFAQKLIKNNTLHIWPRALTHIKTHALTVEKCIGNPKNRNTSGLALIAHRAEHQDSVQHILCTADADYGFIPSVARLQSGCTGIVVPHHGGRAKHATLPPPPIGRANERLAYSYGMPNHHYGHPHATTVQRHVSAGWQSAVTRHTAARPSSRPAHVALRWSGASVVTGCRACDPQQL